MIDVHLTDDFMVGGLAIFISIKHGPDDRRLLRIRENGVQEWEQADSLIVSEPTLKLPEEAARALLDALLRHYQGASDMHTVRQDLLHERGRVDKLLERLCELAPRPQTIELHKAER